MESPKSPGDERTFSPSKIYLNSSLFTKLETDYQIYVFIGFSGFKVANVPMLS